MCVCREWDTHKDPVNPEHTYVYSQNRNLNGHEGCLPTYVCIDGIRQELPEQMYADVLELAEASEGLKKPHPQFPYKEELRLNFGSSLFFTSVNMCRLC